MPNCIYRLMVTLIILSIFLSVNPQFAHSGNPSAEPRTILALFDSTESLNPRSDRNLIHKGAEMVLNHLGLKVVYHDINLGLPNKDLAEVLGILMWFEDDKAANSAQYVQWLIDRLKEGKKIVLFGTFGFMNDEEGKELPRKLLEHFFEEYGVDLNATYEDNPLLFDLDYVDAEMMNFERDLEGELEVFPGALATDPNVKVLLRLVMADKSAYSEPIFISPRGAIALDPYVVYYEYVSDRFLWRINPFLFFEEAFGVSGEPRFDTTTLWGRRILYVHIDGDGIRNISMEDGQTPAGEIIRDQLLKKYSFPTAVSFITADIDQQIFGSEKILELAQSMLKLPNTELGVHAFSHPFDWERQITAYEIPGYSRAMNVLRDAELLKTIKSDVYADGAIVTQNKDQYLWEETAGAIQFSEQFIALPQKRVTLYQWSGNCLPPAQAIDHVDQLGIMNINGGDSRLDPLWPSYSSLAPLIRQVDGRIQYYSSMANENIYTHNWTGPFDGFTNLLDTFQQTEVPGIIDGKARRVKPLNIYYHFYSGERQIALYALKTIYQYVDHLDKIAIFPSDFVSIVQGYLSAEWSRRDDGSYHFSNYQNLRTVRFDREARFPDMEKSVGIAGFTRWEDALYIHLLAGEAVLYWTDSKPDTPYVDYSEAILSDLSLTKDEIVFDAELFDTSTLQFAGFTAGQKVLLEVYRDSGSRSEFSKRFKVGDDGVLRVQIPLKGNVRVRIGVVV